MCGDQWRFCRETGRLVIDNSNIAAAIDFLSGDMMGKTIMSPDKKQQLFSAVKMIIGEIALLFDGQQDNTTSSTKR